MSTELYKYQQAIVDNQLTPQTALFMDMGTGKTVTSLNVFKKFRTKRLLIICLISKMKDWQHDIAKECGMASVILDKGTPRNIKLLQKDNDAYIVNFESAWRLGATLLKWVDKNTTVIIDESHKIKNPTSKIGKFCAQLKNRTEHKIILTGTPQSQGYIDYYNQLYFLDMLNYPFSEFKKLFCVYTQKIFNGFPVKQLTGYQNTKVLDELIRNRCVFYERKVNEEIIPTDGVEYFSKPKK